MTVVGAGAIVDDVVVVMGGKLNDWCSEKKKKAI